MRVDEKIPPRRLGRYILHERMARGGMAEVYRATLSGEGGFERAVAVKCIHPDLAGDPALEERFIQEARTVGALHHANIVQVLELGRERDGTLFIAMELIEGRDLRDVLRRARALGTPVPLPLAAYVVSEVAKGLAYAHRATGPDGRPMGVVHRDVTPRNILIGFHGEVKVIDFGIAKGTVRTLFSDPSVWKGKLGYMSPEQLECAEVDHRSDIYTLGLVLFEMVAGRRLFERDTGDPSLVDVRAFERLDLRAELPGAPKELVRALRRSLALRPKDRYARADLLLKDLQPLLIVGRGLYGATDVGQLMERLYAHEIHDSDVQFPTLIDLTEREEETLPARPFPRKARPPSAAATEPARSDLGAAPRTPGPAALRAARPSRPSSATLRTSRRPRRIPSRVGAIALGALVSASVAAALVIVAPSLRDPARPWVDPHGTADLVQPVRGSLGDERPVAPAVERYGFLTLDVVGPGSEAGARIFIDGQLVGDAPLLAHRLPLGTHEIEAIAADAVAAGTPPRGATTLLRIRPSHTRERPLRRVLLLRELPAESEPTPSADPAAPGSAQDAPPGAGPPSASLPPFGA